MRLRREFISGTYKPAEWDVLFLIEDLGVVPAPVR